MKFAFTADEHFRSTVPVARKDDYLKNQDDIIKWLNELSKKYTMFSCGDTVHHARERAKPLDFANYLLKELPHRYGILGNHDLLYHTTDTLDSTTMGLLIQAGKYTVLDYNSPIEFDKVKFYGFSYGQEIKHIPRWNRNPTSNFTRIALYHGYVTQEPNEFIEGKVAIDLLKSFPEYDIIFSGDNHQGFMVELEGRVLINIGSLKRDNADQMEHIPYVYTYDSQTKKVDRIEVPIDKGILTKDHIEKEQERNERLENLSEKFKEVRDVTLDFNQNLLNFFKMNKINEDVQSRIMEWVQ